MWISSGFGSLYYYESLDGLTNWAAYASNPVLTLVVDSFPTVYKIGTTYYCYEGGGGNVGGIQVHTSSDGVTWGAGVSTVGLVNGAGGAWDSAEVGQFNVLGVVSGTWYGYYQGNNGSTIYGLGLATSSDGLTWKKSGTAPAVQGGGTGINRALGSAAFATVNGKYYLWAGGFLTSTGNVSKLHPCFRFSATSPSGPWTEVTSGGTPVPTYYSAWPSDFIGSPPLNTDITDVALVSANGNLYFYWTKTNDGIANGGIQAALASSTTLAQLVTGWEGVLNAPFCAVPSLNFTTLGSDNFARSGPGMGANWTNITTTGAWDGTQIVSSGIVEALNTSVSGQSFYSGATWPNDQWCQVTVPACSGTSVVGGILRQDTSGAATCYRFYWCGVLGTSGTMIVDKYVGGTSHSSDLGANTIAGITLNVGDTITGVIVGTKLYVYWNNYLILSCIDTGTPIASGAAGILIYTAGPLADAQISAWSGGGLQAVPDNGIQGALGAGGAGATVAWTGSSTGSVTADVSGNYNTGEALLPFGSYVITPSKTGYTFSPTSASETVNGADITGVDFGATQTLVATPTFSPVAGTYTSAQTVTISSTTAGASIYWNTTGSPTSSDTLYTGPITVSASETIYAIAEKAGYVNSAVGLAAYVINIPSGGGGAAWLMADQSSLEDIPRRRGH
jgi:hypothetical protein